MYPIADIKRVTKAILNNYMPIIWYFKWNGQIFLKINKPDKRRNRKAEYSYIY